MTPLVAAKNVLRVEESGSEFDMGPSTWSAGTDIIRTMRILRRPEDFLQKLKAALSGGFELVG